MRRTNKLIQISCYLVCFYFLSGCASVTTVKDIKSNQSGYLSKNFSVQSVNKNALERLPKSNSTGLDYKELTINYEVEDDLANGKKNLSVATAKYTPLGHDLFQRVWEYKNNGIPSFLLFHTSYKGFLNLRWQAVIISSGIANPIFEIKKITRLDPIPEKVNDQFTVDFETGREHQIGEGDSGRFICKVSSIGLANTVDAKLHGKSLEFVCESYSKDVLQGRVTWLLLENYGAAIMLENATSSSKMIFRVKGVSVN